MNRDEPRLVCAADVTPVSVRWLWPGWLPVGKFVLIDGNPGVGKSMITCDLAAGLQGGDYQPGTLTINVKRQLLKDTTPPTFGDPKTWAGIRSLTLSPPLAARIQNLGAVGDSPVFTRPDGGLLDVSNFRSRHFYPAVQTAGLGHVRIHDLRHTAISSWINQGATIKAVTARAGIASVATAFDRYGHLYPTEDRDLADRLDDVQ